MLYTETIYVLACWDLSTHLPLIQLCPSSGSSSLEGHIALDGWLDVTVSQQHINLDMGEPERRMLVKNKK